MKMLKRQRQARSEDPRRWETKDGSPTPLGPAWIADEKAYNFAIYSKYAISVKLFLYHSSDVFTPVLIYEFDHFKNKTGRICMREFQGLRCAMLGTTDTK